jgi:hypothetical protein
MKLRDDGLFKHGDVSLSFDYATIVADLSSNKLPRIGKLCTSCQD